MEEHRKVGNYTVFPFMVDDVIDRDKKNVLSRTSVFGKDGTIITNIIISPLAEKTEKDIVEQAMERCKKTASQRGRGCSKNQNFQKYLRFSFNRKRKEKYQGSGRDGFLIKSYILSIILNALSRQYL